MNPNEIINFWFEEISPNLRFAKDDQFDQLIRSRFSEIYTQVLSNETAHWRKSPEGRLAEIIVLDQFARNMYRDSAQAFAGDVLALQLAQEGVKVGDDQRLSLEKRSFMYMPYMHSEDPEIHKIAVRLFSQKGLENSLDFEIRHKKIIDRFGRYPHRNAVLGRTSTAEEIEFLKETGSSF